MKNLFVIITIYLLFQGIKATEIQDDAIENVLSREQCDNNCYNVVRPLLSQLTHLKEQLDAYDEIKQQFVKDLETSERQIKEQIMLLKNQMSTNFINGVQHILIANSMAEWDSLSSTGWTVIQRRLNGNVSFDRNWYDYKHGFGDRQGDFFIGLEELHTLTQARPHELYIQLRDVKGVTRYARYDDFNVGNEKKGYKLTSLGSYNGTAGDSLSDQVGTKFSTRDQDNSEGDLDCTSDGSGGWWYSNCGYSQLNGIFHKDGIAPERNGIGWGTWDNFNYNISLIYSQMMIRPTI